MIEETKTSMEEKLNLRIDNFLCIIDTLGYNCHIVFITPIFHRSGIYYLMDNKFDMLYIGKSQKLRSRINQHHNSRNKKEPWMNDVKYIAIMPCEVDLLSEIEKQEISKYDPLFNKQFRVRGSKIGSRLTELEKLNIESDYILQKVDKLNIILADALYELRIINEKKHNLNNEIKKR